MKNDLSCAVVQDLLPAYTEGLTAPETNEAVERHLADCPDCAAHLAAMQAPETAEQEETGKEVDYFKTVRRRGRRRVALAVALTVLALIGGLAAMVFIIGSPADTETMVLNIWTSDEALQVEVSSRVSANAYWGWETETADGVVTITAREGLVSALHPTAAAKLSVPLEGIDEVYLCGRLIWQEGMEIRESTLALYGKKTPYVGNASAVGAALNEIDHWFGPMGPYTFSLETAAPPYGLTVNLESPMTRSTEIRYAALVLALVENLDTVTWSCPDAQGTPQSVTYRCADVETLLSDAAAERGLEAFLRPSIKDYAASPAALEQLTALLV
ncbi:DUF4825 domain-containing protein [uncultured Oscillibacter sp.]|uniref:DUF4825 domain-containing protein n=1 Tax=uncultured Oscillibacter sp. TaxID=876091 RepID=UPI00280BC6FD|nr:DUF4825 domain-containing protein [uncultured Oscillibacter sp.]